MGLQHADGVADFFGEAQQGGGGVDVGGDAEVGALDGDEPVEIDVQRVVVGEVGACRELKGVRHLGRSLGREANVRAGLCPLRSDGDYVCLMLFIEM